MERKIKLQLPTPQNFIILDIPTPIGQRQDGFKPIEKPSIPIQDLSQDEAEQYAEELKQQFIKHYQYKKNSKSNPYSSLNRFGGEQNWG